MHPGVKMFRTQPVADGPAGPDRARRPVGTDDMYTVHDEVRPTAGGPVGRFPDPGPLKYSKLSSPDDSYQPLVTGPSGTNEMNAINNSGRPTAGGPLGEVHRGRVYISKANRPTDSSGSVVHGLGKKSAQTKSESESVAGIPNPVIQTGNEVQIDRVNISMANG